MQNWFPCVCRVQNRSLLTEQAFLPDVLPSLCDTFVSKKIIATPMKIGFLGLGLIGSGAVDSLLRSGHEVTIWNRTASKVIPLSCPSHLICWFCNYCAMYFSAKRMLAIACRPSVCLWRWWTSTAQSRDVGGLWSHNFEFKSWKLIAQTSSQTPSLYVAKRRATYSQENTAKFWGY